MCRVSIVMGVKDCCDKVSNSIESILRQTFSDWEFIICDDGSTDGTYKILCDYSRMDPRIKVLRNDCNMGLASTLNKCIKGAVGRYIARQDADDYSYPERLEKQVAFLDNHGEYDLVGCCVELFDNSGVWGIRRLKEYPQKKDFLWGSQFVHPTVVARRESIKKAGCYRVAKETRRTEDYDLFMRMYALGMKGCNLQETLFAYYEDKSSYSKRKYRYRIDEAFVRYKGFKALGLMPNGFLYVIKPLTVGLIPSNIMFNIKKGFRV